jgi:hypothetical protein
LNRFGSAAGVLSAPWLQATADVERMVAERRTVVVRGEEHPKPLGTTFHEVTDLLDASHQPRHPLLATMYVDNLARYLHDRSDAAGQLHLSDLVLREPAPHARPI